MNRTPNELTVASHIQWTVLYIRTGCSFSKCKEQNGKEWSREELNTKRNENWTGRTFKKYIHGDYSHCLSFTFGYISYKQQNPVPSSLKCSFVRSFFDLQVLFLLFSVAVAVAVAIAVASSSRVILCSYTVFGFSSFHPKYFV